MILFSISFEGDKIIRGFFLCKRPLPVCTSVVNCIRMRRETDGLKSVSLRAVDWTLKSGYNQRIWRIKYGWNIWTSVLDFQCEPLRVITKTVIQVPCSVANIMSQSLHLMCIILRHHSSSRVAMLSQNKQNYNQFQTSSLALVKLRIVRLVPARAYLE